MNVIGFAESPLTITTYLSNAIIVIVQIDAFPHSYNINNEEQRKKKKFFEITIVNSNSALIEVFFIPIPTCHIFHMRVDQMTNTLENMNTPVSE